MTYHIYSVIRWGFPLSKMTTNNYISPIKLCVIDVHVLPFLNIPKDLDPSYKTYLDCWDCFVRKKTLSYSPRNMVLKFYFRSECSLFAFIICESFGFCEK